MNNISKFDKNFRVVEHINKDGFNFYNIDNEQFSIHGVFKENGRYHRMPESIAKTVSEGVYNINNNTAGGRVRFKTDSKRIAIIAKMSEVNKNPHNPLTATSGFDMYFDDMFVGAFIPTLDITSGYESCLSFDNNEMKNVTINFSISSSLDELYIGIDEGAVLESPVPYKNIKPIVYYGSSITQGGCASRPGNIYQNFISRRFNCDYINLGFSGNAKAEDEIADYVADLDMSVFVYDYDHNAPTVEHLKNTHEKMFKAVRSKHPDLPIIMMSRPRYYIDSDVEQRLQVIKTTYDNAVAAGDKNVYLITGKELMAIAGHDGTVDFVHPNDLGFYSMAEALANVLKTII